MKLTISAGLTLNKRYQTTGNYQNLSPQRVEQPRGHHYA